MTPADLDSLYVDYNNDDDILNFSEAQFTLGSELTTGKHLDGSASQPRKGPRGGKKPPRPRQQQLSLLEAELEQKLRDLKAAEAERERLKQRIKILELVLPVREHYAQLLKHQRQAAHVRPPAYAYPQEAVPLAIAQRITKLRASVSSGGRSSSGPSGSDQASDDTLNPSAHHTSAAAAGLWQRQDAQTRSSCSAEDQTNIEDTFTSGRIALFTSVPAHNRVPCQVLCHVSGLWKQWMREAGLLLHAYDARPHDPGPQLKVVQLYEQQLVPTFCSLRMEHPFLLTELLCINFETGEHEEPPPESFWIPVAQGMQPTPEQAADAKAALALYNERTGKALEERRRLAARLGSLFATLQGMATPRFQSAGQQACTDDKVGQLALQVDVVAGQLYRNVMEQGSALEVVEDFMGSRIFSLVQMVRAGVLSYPYFPDLVAILNSIDATSPCAGPSRPEAMCRLTGLHDLPALRHLH